MHTEAHSNDTAKGMSALAGAALSLLAGTFEFVPRATTFDTINQVTGFALAVMALFFGGRRLLATVRS